MKYGEEYDIGVYGEKGIIGNIDIKAYFLYRFGIRNIDDRDWNVISRLTKQIYGKLFADRGYLSQKLFERFLMKILL